MTENGGDRKKDLGVWRETKREGTETQKVNQRQREMGTGVGNGRSEIQRSEILMIHFHLSSVPWISLRGDDDGALLSTPSPAQDADSQDINTFPANA